MKIVKMFDFYEDKIYDALEEADLTDDFMENIFADDTATSWYIFTEEDKEEYSYSDYRALIDKVLLEAGCELGERVYIWMSW